MAYAWSAKLETGNATIDSQHKELIEAINKLLTACANRQGRVQIEETGKFLLNYTKRHFGDEEVLQIRSRYPDRINHKKYHEKFILVVKTLVEELDKTGPSVVLVSKINSAIAGWLINHITTEDVKVAAHIKATL